MIYVNARFFTQKITGVQRFAREIAKELANQRDDIIFLVPSISDIVDIESLNGINILEANGGCGHFWEQITLPFFLYRRGNPLLLNLCNTAPVLYHNKIITLHDITYIKYPRSYSLKFRMLYRVITPLIIKGSRKIITVSEFSRKEISNYYNLDYGKVSVVYNAVTNEIKKIQAAITDRENKYLLAVSSQNFHKNFHTLIQAFSGYTGSLSLKIIGDKAQAFNGIEHVSNDDRIQFLGRVSDVELANLYTNAYGFIFPSLYEGFGIPPLEAQYCGCPVISSDRASMPEVLGNSVLYFNPESTSEIVMAILKLENNKNIRDELIERGRENASRFSWSKSALEVNNIINEHLNKRA
ncbi:TPA: glycosyltransferase family 4 protein [Klebsiella quasipneumoniae]|uniref:Glycosyltransferase n=1 Tax=Klebsiella pneumoniae TaxID=573 RepID=A0A1C3SZV4_KLEPN|nr:MULTISPECIES: glycosyltransferase family 1 protein [Klebsiella]KGT62405.1 glycosyltransferase, group 1 family protein [Klebsiella pneumoniae MRSN 1319]MBE8826502.1 glycosyltransferase family 4 protein [Klebsiella quasipneumoniae]MBU8951105.1 glycosyltransferase family 4 protein [Klebsiella quasipneumoniae]MBY0592834.1 glycosyltransferase family 4 protein [Klebsiella sp. TFW1]MBY0603506.1 glycosyltransferase family 4 protein [Klebsiella sp. TF21-TM]